MKAFCINLKERPENWVKFRSQQLPFEVERFEAIKDSPGWKGCTKSHLEIMKKIDGMTIVMEDDCLFLKEWNYIEDIMKQLPDNWDALYLGATLNVPLEKYSDNLFRLKGGWTTHAIIYKDDTIPKFIVKHMAPIRKIDVYLAELQEKFNVFITYPLTATQRPGYSDVINREQDYAIINERYKLYVKV